MAGFDIPEGTKFFIVPETGYGPEYPFSGEKMTVTMALYRAKDLDDATKAKLAKIFEKRKPKELERAEDEMPGDARE